MFPTPRNRILAAIAALACVLALGSTVRPAWAAGQPAAAAAGTGRVQDFGQGWRFALVNPDGLSDPTGAFADAHQPGYDDSGWRRVNVPHDWSIELNPTDSASTDPGTGFLQGGLGWYRKTFTLPSALAGKRISVEFDGVYMDSHIFFNGRPVGTHPYGYTGFDVDLTDLAHTDGTTPNVLAVKVRNQLPSSRWYSGSGIYRNVHLVVTDPVHVARHGVFVTTPGLERTYAAGFATVHVATAVAGDGEPVEVVSTIRDARGRTVAAGHASGTAGGAPAAGDIRLDRPNLWSMERPYLYTLRTEVRAGGRTADTTTTTFGVRWFEIDGTEGFSLNGEYRKIQGVNLHHDLGALGAATNRDALVRQMTIMKSMGVNALRTSHNPPSPELVDVCQQLGIVMMVEAFDTWQSPKTTFDYARFFEANADADIKEMVNAHKNSPSVIIWSIGNEIRGQTFATAQRLYNDIKSIDQTRPVVWGHDGYRSVPRDGSVNDQIARLLDGVGLNYNTAQSVDALHAKYPDKFFFESESSSSTSTRGVYQDPEQLNTGENYTPGRRGVSSYDNNMAPWTMPGEYGLKKDRDRKFFIGEFLWSGFDYLGEPTPYFDNFPVKASFFGATDTAGFPKDLYHLFRSQWTTRPMVHLLPMNWTDHEPGEPVQVWAYANVDTVELFHNGRSLGVRRFDHKTTTDGRPYLETTEPTGDDKTFPTGSYTSPNGSTGKLHLTWSVPFAPGRLVAKASRDGKVVATDQVETAGAPRALRLNPDKKVISADGTSLSYVTVDVVDDRGVTVPGAGNAIDFAVTGGTLAGLDNGREESAENYKASSRTAFNGKALAIVRSTGRAGPITVTATSPGLRTATTVIAAGPAPGAAPAAADPYRPPAAPPPPDPGADASYSGTPNTLPAAMLDGDLATGWSNFYNKAATALLPAISRAHAADWVSVTPPGGQPVGRLRAFFTVDGAHAMPAAINVSHWNGTAFVPVRNLRIDRAAESNQPTTITFDPVRSSEIRLDLTSPAPGTTTGFLRIAELNVGDPT
jgi:beta-galactosidase